MSEKSIALLILTGGLSKRFGGRKKILLEREGKTFASHILDAFCEIEKVYLSVDREEKYRDLGLPMIPDHYPGCGPLGGIVSGLEECAEDALFVIACDMPFITPEAVRCMLEARERQDGILLAEHEGKIEPLFGIYPKRVLQEAQKMLKDGNYRTRDLFEKTGGSTIMICDGERLFVNINTPEDYRKSIVL